MNKPRSIDGYTAQVTDACERVLVTLLRGLGPWKELVYLIGGLAPRYLVTARPPQVPRHAVTGDVDVVVDFTILTDTEAYRTLEDNLRAMGFERAENDRGQKQSWRWKAAIEGGAVMILEFLADAPALSGGRVTELPTEGNVTAINIPHASMVFDHHRVTPITAELLNGGGRTTEEVRHADIVSFTCLKAFAYDQRHEPKDAHDLVYCLEHHDGGLAAARDAFRAALSGPHGAVVRLALDRLGVRFIDPDPDQSYRRDGPVAVARFEADTLEEDDEDQRDRLILRQRHTAELMRDFLTPLVEA